MCSNQELMDIIHAAIQSNSLKKFVAAKNLYVALEQNEVTKELVLQREVFDAMLERRTTMTSAWDMHGLDARTNKLVSVVLQAYLLVKPLTYTAHNGSSIVLDKYLKVDEDGTETQFFTISSWKPDDTPGATEYYQNTSWSFLRGLVGRMGYYGMHTRSPYGLSQPIVPTTQDELF